MAYQNQCYEQIYAALSDDMEAEKVLLSDGRWLEFLKCNSVEPHLKKLLQALSEGVIIDVNQKVCLSIAVAALQLFVQLNWTGPTTMPLVDIQSALFITSTDDGTLQKTILSRLAVDSEPLFEGVVCPALLCLSRFILAKYCVHSRSVPWLTWQLRSIFVHQSMIEERCGSLKLEAMSCITALMTAAEFPVTASKDSKLSETDGDELDEAVSVSCDVNVCRPGNIVEWQLEAAHLARLYFEHDVCKTLLANAQKVSNLDVKFTGVPGKRTRYQYKDIAQLILDVHISDQSQQFVNDAAPRLMCSKLPKNHHLHDDTVMDEMKLTTDDSNAKAVTSDQICLSSVEQALILSLCEENMYIKSQDADLITEETEAFLRFVLSDPCDWSVQCKALFLRSLSEKHSGRRAERALRQLEDLSQVSRDTEPDVMWRLRTVYSCSLPAVWQVQRSLGELNMEIGAYASAMEVFDRLHLWNPLIICSQRAGRTGKAEELIRKRLAIDETPALYCSLADVTGNPDYYHTAWELSNLRSARAMRGLAYHYLRAGEYEKAMEYFEKTLSINPLQLACWFSYGCSSLASQSYDKAASAFRRCVSLNTDNFEAWNNLAAAYARNKQKARAFNVLQDAIKCNYDNWRVWENYVLIGSDCGQISEVIRGAHRILELKGKWEDEQVVKHVTRLVLDNVPDANGQPSSCHRKIWLEVLGHATAKVTNNSVLWWCYGQVLLTSPEPSTETIERGVQCLQKAYRCASIAKSWDKDEEKCVQNTDILLHLVDSYVKVGTKKYISTARLQLKGHMARLRQSHTDPITKTIKPNIDELVGRLDKALDTLPAVL